MIYTCKPPYEQLLVGMVVGSVSSLGAGVLLIILCPRCYASVVVDVAVSTCDPTCEQSLAVGGVLGYPGVVLVVVAVVVPLLLDHSDVAVSTHCPPCKQWLAAVGVGALLVALCRGR